MAAGPRRFYPAPVASERLSIAQVSPHPWGAPHEVNEFVARVSAGLAERGHRVVVAAPAASRSAVRESRRQIRAARERPAALFDGSWKGETAGGDGGPPVLSVGSSLAMPRGPAPRAAPVPIDLSRPLEELLGGVEFDIVHVHDPFAPSAASAALRHSRSLNVGSFHEPSERILSTQVARPLVEIFFGRLDARTASCRTTSDLMERFFPGTYELVTPGRRPGSGGLVAAAPRCRHGLGGGSRAARADRVLPSGGARRAAAVPPSAPPPAAGACLGGGGLALQQRRDPHRAPAARPGSHRRPWRGVARRS